jgi:hypothetical protein
MFLRVYLAVYYALVLGAGVTLWRAGVLPQLAGFWVIAVGIGAVGAGILLAVVSQERRQGETTASDKPASGDSV